LLNASLRKDTVFPVSKTRRRAISLKNIGVSLCLPLDKIKIIKLLKYIKLLLKFNTYCFNTVPEKNLKKRRKQGRGNNIMIREDFGN